MKGVLKLDPDTREKGMSELTKYLTKGAHRTLFSEEFESLGFDQLSSELSEADNEASKSPNAKASRIKLQYAYALRRDAIHSYRSRRELMGLAHHNEFRGLYEGGKYAIDSEKPV